MIKTLKFFLSIFCRNLKGNFLRRSLGFVLLAVLCTNVIACSNDDGGSITEKPEDGSAENPFKVYDLATLQKVGTGADGWALNVHYLQVANIDVGSIDNWEPIGKTQGEPFTGAYDGGGFSIQHLKINIPTASYQGLFAYTETPNSVIKNVALTDVSIVGAATVGGIVGRNGAGTIQNCYVTGNISGSNRVGGIAGQNLGGLITDCYTTCNLTSKGTGAGGIVGSLSENIMYPNQITMVQYCYATGNISITSNDGYNIGGISGYTSQAATKNCVALNKEVKMGRADIYHRIGRVLPSKGTNNFARATGMILQYNTNSTPVNIDVGTEPTSYSGHGANVVANDYNGVNSGTWWRVSSGPGFNVTFWSLAANRLPQLKTTTGRDFDQPQNAIVIP